MALDDSDTGTGCQAAVIFSQVGEGGLALKLSQVFDSQRQAKATVADERHIIAAKDDRPEGNVVLPVFALRQFNLDQHLLVRFVDDTLPAALLYTLDQFGKHRVERCLCGYLHIARELPQLLHELPILARRLVDIANVKNTLAHTIAIGPPTTNTPASPSP